MVSCCGASDERPPPTGKICAVTTWLFTHPACLTHEMGAHHPESPARLKAILAALEAPEFEALVRREGPPRAGRAVAPLPHPRVLYALPAGVASTPRRQLPPPHTP